jgi:hypothetical protein
VSDSSVPLMNDFYFLGEYLSSLSPESTAFKEVTSKENSVKLSHILYSAWYFNFKNKF